MAATQFYLPWRPAFDSNGLIVAGAELYFYASGTSTPQSVYADETLLIELANPVTANAAGVWPIIYLDNTLSYRAILKDGSGNTLNDADPYLPLEAERESADAIEAAGQARADRLLAQAARYAADEDAAQTAADRAATEEFRDETEVFRDEADDLLTDVASALALGTVSDLVGTRIYTSRSALEADLVPADGEYALVVGDATAANNDLYLKNGATTTGSWDGPLGIFAAASAEAQAAADAAAASAASFQYVDELVDGFDFSDDTGPVLAGIDPTTQNGSITANRLIVVDEPGKNTVYSQIEIWNAFITQPVQLSCFVLTDTGWVYSHHIDIPNGGSTGAYTTAITFAAPGGSRVCLSASSGGRFGVRVGNSRPTFVMGSSDPSGQTTPFLFTSIGYEPAARLTGTYSQIVDFGAVKEGIDNAPVSASDGIHNLSVGATARIREALKSVRDGTGDATLLVIGDSIEAGAGASSGAGFWIDSFQRGYLGQLRTMLSGYYTLDGDGGLYLPVQYNRIGSGSIGNGQTMDQYDPRFISMGDFAVFGPSDPAVVGLGGGVLRSPSSGDNSTLAWQHDEPINRIEIRYYRRPTDGQFRWRIDGGAWTTVNAANPTATYETLEIPLGVSTHLLEIERVVGTGDIIIQAIMGWNTTQKALRIINAGWSGGNYTGLTVATNPWSPAFRLAEEPADLKVLALGANDITAASVPETVTSNYVGIMDTMSIFSDVLYAAPTPQDDTGTVTESIQLAHRKALFAGMANYPMIDVYGYFGDWATADGRLLFDDGIHPSYEGHTLLAGIYKKLLGRLA